MALLGPLLRAAVKVWSMATVSAEDVIGKGVLPDSHDLGQNVVPGRVSS